MSRLPVYCPACREQLNVNKLTCGKCQTQVEGLYDLPLLLRLEPEEQRFILDFLKCSGSLKAMAALMKLSYPTVRNRLDDIIGKIKQLEQSMRTETKEPNS